MPTHDESRRDNERRNDPKFFEANRAEKRPKPLHMPSD
jgi:hypothetical protein